MFSVFYTHNICAYVHRRGPFTHMGINISTSTVLVRIEAPDSISFWKVLTWPLFEPGLHLSPAAISYVQEIIIGKRLPTDPCTLSKRKASLESTICTSLFGHPLLEKNFR